MFVDALHYSKPIPSEKGSLYEFDARNFDNDNSFNRAQTFARMMVSDPKYKGESFHDNNNTLCKVGQLRVIDINAWSALSNA
ncbi:unnamed protein product [Cylicocyclus nassatus]|uniref:Uncharacterized protein n=1 Tax=Cylicocyclus nassatus TaxID=53992 RepID=A0AA36DU52_CYLNA|nr:unnamed protein product [Cylicocyclus nassatus]